MVKNFSYGWSFCNILLYNLRWEVWLELILKGCNGIPKFSGTVIGRMIWATNVTVNSEKNRHIGIEYKTGTAKKTKQNIDIDTFVL